MNQIDENEMILVQLELEKEWSGFTIWVDQIAENRVILVESELEKDWNQPGFPVDQIDEDEMILIELELELEKEWRLIEEELLNWWIKLIKMRWFWLN
jgi:hypothetical protein